MLMAYRHQGGGDGLARVHDPDSAAPGEAHPRKGRHSAGVGRWFRESRQIGAPRRLGRSAR